MAVELEELLASGAAAERAGNVREAMIRYQAAVSLAPRAAAPLIRLGALCHCLRQYPRARTLLEQAVRLDPDSAEARFRLGLACEAQGDRTAATAAYARTMELAPASWETWYLIGRQHRQLGHGEVARAAYQKALAAAPEQADVLAELGSLLWETGRDATGFDHMTRACALRPVDPAMRVALARASIDRDDFVTAQRLLTEAKHLDPSDALIDRALEELGERRRRARRRKKAA